MRTCYLLDVRLLGVVVELWRREFRVIKSNVIDLFKIFHVSEHNKLCSNLSSRSYKTLGPKKM